MPEIDFQPDKRTIEDLFVGADYYVIRLCAFWVG